MSMPAEHMHPRPTLADLLQGFAAAPAIEIRDISSDSRDLEPGDLFLAVVIVPNMIALVLLSPQVLAETRSYFERKPWRENELKRQQLKREGKL